ncbi:MAG: NAD(P)H-dependent glycerol-3-phosphate dehydrogenase [Balneolales bacterium]
MNVTIIGAGSWGTALAMVLSKAGNTVNIWARETTIVENINSRHINGVYLPNIQLPSSIKAFSELKDALKDADLVVFATPSHTVRELARCTRPYLSGHEVIVNVAKGIENNTFMTMTQILAEVLEGCIIEDHIGVLCGPSHAEEVSLHKPTTVVSAANSKTTAKIIQQAFMTPMFRVYVNHDVIGVEVAGSVKNILAIAAGIVEGLDLGDNASAALLTRGLAEMKRLGQRLGASQDTFSGLAGIGDLIVTCTSRHSRNRFVGYQIGKGETLEEIVSKMNMVAEGVNTTRSVYKWSQKLNVDMPITERVYNVLFENVNPKDTVYDLMTRDPKEEILM